MQENRRVLSDRAASNTGLLRDFHFAIAARRHGANCGYDFSDTRFDQVPVVRAQHQYRHFPARQVLLIGELLIRRNEQIETRFFRRRQQRTVFQPGPALKPRGDNCVTIDQQAKFLRDALIENDFFIRPANVLPVPA